MCNASWLHNYTVITPHPVVLGNNCVVYAVGRGIIQASVPVQGRVNYIELKDMYYVPDFGKNLISVQCAITSSCKGILKGGGCTIIDVATHDVILEATQTSNGLMAVPFQILAPVSPEFINTTREPAADLNILHCRFGHVGEEKL
jgi:hypothetical protein